MVSIRDVETRNSKYGPVTEVIVAGPRPQLEELREMYDKPLSRDFWGVDRDQYSWERDGALRLGFISSESEARAAVQDAVFILGFPRPNPLPDDRWFVIRFEGDTYAGKTLFEAVEAVMVDDVEDLRDAEWAIVTASDAGAARVTHPRRWRRLTDTLRRTFAQDPFLPVRVPRNWGRLNPVKASDYLKRVGATPRHSEPEEGGARHEVPKRKKPQDAPPTPRQKRLRPPAPEADPSVEDPGVSVVMFYQTENARREDIETLVRLLREAGIDAGKQTSHHSMALNAIYGALVYVYDRLPASWKVEISPPTLYRPTTSSGWKVRGSKMGINFPRNNPPPDREIDVVRSVVSSL